jgi:hypothetical protein
LKEGGHSDGKLQLTHTPIIYKGITKLKTITLKKKKKEEEARE